MRLDRPSPSSPRLHLAAAAALAAVAHATDASAQELRVFDLSSVPNTQVHWTANSNLGPMGAFNQSYTFSGDVVVDFDVSPATGVARITDARLLIPNSVVAVLMSSQNPGLVAFHDVELGATSPDFTIVPGLPGGTFATTIDLVVLSGTMTVEPPFGPAFLVNLSGNSLGSIPIQGSFPSVGPTQQMRVGSFAFDMPFQASGWSGAFHHDVASLQAIAGCPAPSAYCPSDPQSPGGGTELAAAGSTSVAADHFGLVVTRAPANAIGVFFHGARRGAIASGQGTVCIGGPLARLGVVTTDANGSATMRVILANHQGGSLPLEPGAHAHFQFHHRVATPQGPSWNFSNAVAVTFCP